MPSTAPGPLLVQLGSHRWLIPLLADLAAHKGARFVELIHRLGLSRDSCARTLEAAADVVKNLRRFCLIMAYASPGKGTE